MPVYEYRCKDCGKEIEILVISNSDLKNISCKTCGSSNLERLFSASYVNVKEKRAESPHCGKQTTCCGSDVPCEHPPCSS